MSKSPVYAVIYVPASKGAPQRHSARDRSDAIAMARTLVTKHAGIASVERNGEVVKRYGQDRNGIAREIVNPRRNRP